MKLCAVLLALSFILAAPLSGQDVRQPVLQLLEAFNAHDPERMGQVVADDVEVFYVAEDGAAELGTRGRAQLVAEMTDYFQALPDVQSEVEAMISGNTYVSLRERIVGGDASLAVYEVRDGRIQRVWYYPVDG